MANLLIYRASAGSGKTYTLVTHYIQWALHYPDAFKHILAVTFTNRATQEMKQRIISALHSLAIGEVSALGIALCDMGWKPVPLQKRSREVLSLILYRYSEFSVVTVDSFFHKIVQSFAKELGLSKHFTIEIDETSVLQEAVTALMRSDVPLLQKWLVDFALTKLLSGKKWLIEKDIQYLGQALFKESFKLYEKELLIAFEQKNSLPFFLETLQKLLASFEESMQEIGKRALTILQQEGVTPEHFAYGTKGVIGYFLKLANKTDFHPTKRAIIGSTNLESWLSKKPKDERINKIVVACLRPLLLEAIALYRQEGIRYRTARVVSRFVYSFGIISSLLKELEAYRTKHNVLFISDISALLYQIIQENDTPFFYEKIGNQFHHFLIDEFQDLSLFQWINIKPLLRNSLAQGYANLLVGDVKQAIYRWRGSNWQLLNHQVEEEFLESKVHTLTTNRRSHEMIVLFNSHFFSVAAQLLIQYLERGLSTSFASMMRQELDQIRRVYSDVAQQAVVQPIEQNNGYIEMLFLRSDPIDTHQMTWQELAQNELVRLVNSLQQEGIEDIVVLVRNNHEAAALQTSYGSTLGSHVAIKVLIHALYYLSNRHDAINAIALVQLYCSCIGYTAVVWHHYIADQGVLSALERFLPKAFLSKKALLMALPIYGCIELLIEIFFKKHPEHYAVVFFFQSSLLDLSANECTIASCLTWWEKRGKSIRLPADAYKKNTLRVMTIHQAKGLEFNAVLIPFCSWNLNHIWQHAPTLWCSNLHVPFNQFPVWPVGYGIDLKDSYYAQDYFVEQMQVHLDHLNLLYVAFTRAKERLYVIAPLSETMANVPTVADLLYQSLITEEVKDMAGLSIAQKLLADIQENSRGIKFCFGCSSTPLSNGVL